MSMDDTPAGAFTVHENRRGQTTVLTPSASVTFENCAALRMMLEQAAEHSKPIIVLDARRIQAMDSEALELVQEWHQRLDDMGGSLRIAGLSDTCADILTATRLVHVLNVYATIQQAIAG